MFDITIPPIVLVALVKILDIWLHEWHVSSVLWHVENNTWVMYGCNDVKSICLELEMTKRPEFCWLIDEGSNHFVIRLEELSLPVKNNNAFVRFYFDSILQIECGGSHSTIVPLDADIWGEVFYHCVVPNVMKRRIPTKEWQKMLHVIGVLCANSKTNAMCVKVEGSDVFWTLETPNETRAKWTWHTECSSKLSECVVLISHLLTWSLLPSDEPNVTLYIAKDGILIESRAAHIKQRTLAIHLQDLHVLDVVA